MTRLQDGDVVGVHPTSANYANLDEHQMSKLLEALNAAMVMHGVKVVFIPMPARVDLEVLIRTQDEKR